MSKKNNSRKYFLGIAVAVLLPLSFYILAKVLKKDQIAMPGFFVPDRVDSAVVNGKMSYDTTFHRAADLTGFNQFGDAVSLNNDLKGKILVVDFFFINCPTVCPRLTANMKLLQKAFRATPMKKNEKALQFISVTVNPERDTVHALYEYAKRYKADMNNWWFITGNKQEIYNYARNELHAATPQENSAAEDFVHTQQMILLDEDRNIRGMYDGTDSLSIASLARDIGLLNMEKKKRK